MTVRPFTLLSTPVLPVGALEAASVCATWAEDGGGGRFVCAANVHMVMEAWDAPLFTDVMEAADLVVCDGRPLVWATRIAGVPSARQARGVDVTDTLCRRAARRGLRVGLYGSSSSVLEGVRRALTTLHPGLDIVYTCAPPFRELTDEEDARVVADISAAGVEILFVGLGCPKQERWMMAHRDRLDCLMLGVGAAFEMLAQVRPTAPRWVQKLGLEWLLRLADDPRRLWRRYARYNLRFLVLVGRQLVTQRRA